MTSPRVRDVDAIRWVVLDRPERLHALLPEDVAAIRDAVRDLPAEVRAVVLTGTGERAFCAGVHTDVFPGLDVAGARAFISLLGEMLEAVRRAPVATVCAVNGWCLGGAMELAAACDLRVVGTGARFGMPELAVGIPSVLDAALLPGHLGLSLAKEMVLTGDSYGVADLRHTGFCNRVVEPGEVEATAAGLAAAVGRHAPAAIGAQKRLFEAWANLGLREAITTSVDEFALVFDDAGVREQIAGYRR